MKQPWLVYADTSVFGGVFDPEFRSASEAFFDLAREGKVEVAISALVVDELAGAPEDVSRLFAELEPLLFQVDVDESAYELQEAYLDAGVVSRNWEADALHVAVATVTECRLIVSWNFKHIVNFRRIPLYNGVNMSRGYGNIAIHAPSEVSFDEED